MSQEINPEVLPAQAVRNAIRAVLANRGRVDPSEARKAVQTALEAGKKAVQQANLNGVLANRSSVRLDPDIAEASGMPETPKTNAFESAVKRWSNREKRITREEFQNACSAAYALADAEDEQKLSLAIEESAGIDDDERRGELLEQLIREIPDLFEKVNRESRKPDVFLGILIASFFNAAFNAQAGRNMFSDVVTFPGPVSWDEATDPKTDDGAKANEFLAALSEEEVQSLQKDLTDRATVLAAYDNAQLAEKVSSVAQSAIKIGAEGRSVKTASPEEIRASLAEFKKKRREQAASSQRTFGIIDVGSGFGFWKAGNLRVALVMYPCQEFYRAEDRKIWRDWPTRWTNNGGTFIKGNSDYPAGRMIAPKTAQIWTDLSAFGTPWAPFDYNSGMDLKPMDRKTSIDLGIITPESEQKPETGSLNDGFSIPSNTLSPEMSKALFKIIGPEWGSLENRVKNRAGVDEPPTDAQKEAGNYKKRHLSWNGLGISVENEKDGERSGRDRNGNSWSVKMPSAYGYFKRTDGADGDHVDVYLGDDLGSDKVFVIDQLRGKDFDEHKVMVGFPDEESALACYEKAFADGKGRERIGAVTEMDVDDLKEWLADGDTSEPLANRCGYDAFDLVLLNMGAHDGWKKQDRDESGHWKDEGKGYAGKKYAINKEVGPYGLHQFSKPTQSKLYFPSHQLDSDYDPANDAPYEKYVPKPKWKSAGAVVFNEKGQVVLVKPKGGYGGYSYTLPKGMVDNDEDDEKAAHREVGEEAGVKGEIVGDLGTHEGTSSQTHFYLMRHKGDAPELKDGEMEKVEWIDAHDAADRLDSPRDLRVLVKALKHIHKHIKFENRGPVDDALLNSGKEQMQGLREDHPLLAKPKSFQLDAAQSAEHAKVKALAVAGDVAGLHHHIKQKDHSAFSKVMAVHAANEIALKNWDSAQLAHDNHTGKKALPTYHPYFETPNPFTQPHSVENFEQIKHAAITGDVKALEAFKIGKNPFGGAAPKTNNQKFAANYLDQINKQLKGNPYHDAHGHFTSQSGVGHAEPKEQTALEKLSGLPAGTEDALDKKYQYDAKVKDAAKYLAEYKGGVGKKDYTDEQWKEYVHNATDSWKAKIVQMAEEHKASIPSGENHKEPGLPEAIKITEAAIAKSNEPKTVQMSHPNIGDQWKYQHTVVEPGGKLNHKYKTEDGLEAQHAVNPLPTNSFHDVSNWPAHNTAAQGAAKKIVAMEQLYKSGQYTELMNVELPKSEKPNAYQTGIKAAHTKMVEAIKSGKPPTGIVQTAPEPESKPATVSKKAEEPKESDSSEFSIAGWKKTGGQLGSNPGAQYEDKLGNKWYVKFSKSDDHARNEHLSAKLYNAVDSQAIPVMLVKREDGKLGTASMWVEHGKIDLKNPQQKQEAQKQFATQAWLANWDAAGMSMENQAIIDDKYNPGNKIARTLDVGGAILYRAQGSPKGSSFGNVANEWDSLRNPSINPNTASIYGDMTAKQLTDSAKSVAQIPDSLIENLTMKYGPGNDDARKKLAEKLIARKKDIEAKAGLLVKEPTPEQIAKIEPVAKSKEPEKEVKEPNIEKSGDKTEPVAPPLTLPPYTTSVHNASINAKFKKMYDLAAKGAGSELAAIETKADAKQTYAKQAHAYKHQLLKELSMGAMANPSTPTVPGAPAHATVQEAKTKAPKYQTITPEIAAEKGLPKNTPADFKVDAGSLPAKPVIQTSKPEIKKLNEGKVETIHAAALDANLKKIKEVDPQMSAKVNSYKLETINEIEAQLEKVIPEEQATPLKPYHGTIDDMAKEFGIKKAGNAAASVGRFVDLGEVGSFQYNPTTLKPTSETFPDLEKQKKYFQSLPPEQQNIVKSFTGSWYKKINAQFWAGTAEKDPETKNMAKAILNNPNSPPEGTYLKRMVELQEPLLKALAKKRGHILQEPAPVSFATYEGTYGNSYNTRIEAVLSHDVKLLPIDHSSMNHGEKEVIMGPNQRFYIKNFIPANKSKDGKNVLQVVILPTQIDADLLK